MEGNQRGMNVFDFFEGRMEQGMTAYIRAETGAKNRTIPPRRDFGHQRHNRGPSRELECIMVGTEVQEDTRLDLGAWTFTQPLRMADAVGGLGPRPKKRLGRTISTDQRGWLLFCRWLDFGPNYVLCTGCPMTVSPAQEGSTGKSGFLSGDWKKRTGNHTY
ncbi:hypothetical protein Salat_1656300 [Sesamum alatum]|uniref:Uncharacterized protein n=1 Tax=Sesamum alatum TaxID=300844 RepID=A0AAE1Y710_9LAMI|nr:hypothetical protein Salat_1656300 [Sesamum alatum]